MEVRILSVDCLCLYMYYGIQQIELLEIELFDHLTLCDQMTEV